MVDLVIAMVILSLVSISVVGAYTSLMSMVATAFRNSQASWMGNSVMEIYSAKAFDDITTNDSFSFTDRFPNYTAAVTVTSKIVNLSEGTITTTDAASNYKEIAAVISGQGVEDILTYTTLRSNCNEDPPNIVSISTTFESTPAAQADEPRYSNAESVPIKVTFDRAVDISNIDNIKLELRVAQKEKNPTNYEVNSSPSPTITTETDGSLDVSRKNLSLTYSSLGTHTADAIDSYLEVTGIHMGSAVITGWNGSGSDGCLADPANNLPTQAEDKLSNSRIVTLSQTERFSIYTDWTALRTRVAEVDPPSVSDIFDKWKRWDNTSIFRNIDGIWTPALTGEANEWEQIMEGGQMVAFNQPNNAQPGVGMVDLENVTTYSEFSATLWSNAPDDDTIGLVAVYAEGSNICNLNTAPHTAGTGCTSVGVTPYVLVAARTAMGYTQPTNGWGIMYGDGGISSGVWVIQGIQLSGDGTYDHNWGPGTSYSTVAGSGPGRSTRVKITRTGTDGTIITAHTTDFYEGQTGAFNQPYRTGDGEFFTVDLTTDPRLHKFIGANTYGFITHSQSNSRWYNIVFPVQQQVENTDYVIYFENRSDTDTNDNFDFDTWDGFTMNLSTANTISHSGSTTSGIWKWNAGLSRWEFQEGLTIQQLVGYYTHLTPVGGQADQNDYLVKKSAENSPG